MIAVNGYDDLQLRIDRDADGSYRVLATAPDGRTARGSFRPPISDLELDDFVQRVGLARRRRGSADDRMQAIRELGSTLFDALIREDVGTVYYSARSAAAERERGLRITLRLSGSPELMRLPWEFLYKRPRFIAQSTMTPVVRALDVDSAPHPHPVRLPLRILAMVSSPSGYPELDADAERRNLERALEGPRRAGLVELTWLDRATLGELGRRIAEPDTIHVLHYIGHGAYDEATESGVLVLETPQGRAHDVSGEDIGAMLQDEASLRLVVLNACEGARTSHVDPFSGVATSLVNFDIPAVIGMQFEITDDAAIAFSESLYTGLARGLPVDAALAPARRAIIGAMVATEFGTPVLFLRDGDARLFEIADVAAPAPLVEPEPLGAGEPEAPGSEDEVAPELELEPEAEAADAARVGASGHAPHVPAEPSERPAAAVIAPQPAVVQPVGRSSGGLAAVVLGFVAAGLLAVAGVLALGATPEQDVPLYTLAFIVLAAGLAAMCLHYLARPGRDGMVPAVISAAATVIVIVVVVGLSRYDFDFVGWSHFFFDVAMVLLGGWLLVGGRLVARRSGDSTFSASLGFPGAWLIVASGTDIVSGLIRDSAGDSGPDWVLPLSVLAIAAGYVGSAILLAREVRGLRGRGDVDASTRTTAEKPIAAPAETTPIALRPVERTPAEPSAQDRDGVATITAAPGASDWRAGITYERAAHRPTRATVALVLTGEHRLVLEVGAGWKTIEVDGTFVPIPRGRIAEFPIRDVDVERACVLESSPPSIDDRPESPRNARIESLVVDGVPIPLGQSESDPAD
ncbi:hypothetical protein BCL57_001977 [Agromyces flavus]|uniref:CHAT domain-containing protein n=1 Tax=Agromyces flavus TaxID=589382 RepID=A0A1H1Q3C9_9MICO|nr:CHAT domain-containing protein [Agromyces flavus]MCP2367818.1 hypothetical protein [Agromyces flavus]GGI47278.1 hypothetical protein GCM10010932_19660 [Agromyces flavus]SDS17499.1 CHAT domain-containing protein [Agromyces flavus]